jgi:hypothetical protein
MEFLRAYRDAVQEIVDELWSLKKTPSKATLHRAYYDRLGVEVSEHTTSPRSTRGLEKSLERRRAMLVRGLC